MPGHAETDEHQFAASMGSNLDDELHSNIRPRQAVAGLTERKRPLNMFHQLMIPLSIFPNAPSLQTNKARLNPLSELVSLLTDYLSHCRIWTDDICFTYHQNINNNLRLLAVLPCSLIFLPRCLSRLSCFVILCLTPGVHTPRSKVS